VAERVQPMRRSQGVKDKSRILMDLTVRGFLLSVLQVVAQAEMDTPVVRWVRLVVAPVEALILVALVV